MNNEYTFQKQKQKYHTKLKKSYWSNNVERKTLLALCVVFL